MRIEDIYYELSEKPVDEKDFDIEKWRVENPMDYMKAIFVMNKAPNGYSVAIGHAYRPELDTSSVIIGHVHRLQWTVRIPHE